ncbi:MAG TPA: ATP-binding protein [Anaerolineae bacterium]|nr:ATP-binding protein [Anaerolineae bacterium]
MISYAASAELMQAISRQFNTSLDLDEVMGQVLRLTVEATGATRGSLFLLNEKGQVTHYVLARPNQPPEVSRNTVEKVMTAGLAGWIYRQQQGVLVADITTDERWVRLFDDTETKSALGAPLLYQDRVNGVLILHHSQVGFFDESHLSLVMGIAGQAAIAVENARLFTQVKIEHETLYALITGMPIPVLVIDAGGRTIFANQAARQLLLAGVGGPLGGSEEGHKLEAAIENLRQNPARPTVELPWSDNRVFNVSVNEVPQLGTVVTLNDISHLKELDEMKTSFVETVSHDIKNPLTAIHGFATLLGMENLSSRGQANLAGLLHGVEQIQNLIQNLLDLSRIEAGTDEQVEPCDLAEIAEETIANFEIQIAQKEINLTTELPAQLAQIAGNDFRLSQVVANLLGNAIKYTPRGGQVFVGVSQEGTTVRLRVSDNGPGIAPKDQAQIFERFYRVPTMEGSEWIEGTGLGLSIVKAVVEGYGGWVWVESELGAGSTFGCVFPALPADP